LVAELLRVMAPKGLSVKVLLNIVFRFERLRDMPYALVVMMLLVNLWKSLLAEGPGFSDAMALLLFPGLRIVNPVICTLVPSMLKIVPFPIPSIIVVWGFAPIMVKAVMVTSMNMSFS